MKEPRDDWSRYRKLVHRAAQAHPDRWTIPKIAAELGLSKQGLTNQLDTDTSRKLLERIAGVMGLTYEELLESGARKSSTFDQESNISSMESVTLYKRYRDVSRGDVVTLPIWRGVVAGLEDECIFVDDEPTPHAVHAFIVGDKDPEDFVVCKAAGLSMAPRINQTDEVIVRLNHQDFPPNSIVLAQSPDSQKFMKVFRDINGGELHSIDNELYKPIPLRDGWRFLGYAVGIFKPYITDGPNIEYNNGLPLRA